MMMRTALLHNLGFRKQKMTKTYSWTTWFSGFVFTLTVVVACFADPISARSEEAAGDKQAAAAELLQALGGMEQARKTIAQLKTGMIQDVTRRSPDIAPAFSAFVTKELAPDSARVTAYLKDIEKLAVTFYKENFTVAEMKEISAFQRTEAGKKFQRQAPQLLQKMTPRMMQFQQELIGDVMGQKKPPAADENK